MYDCTAGTCTTLVDYVQEMQQKTNQTFLPDEEAHVSVREALIQSFAGNVWEQILAEQMERQSKDDNVNDMKTLVETDDIVATMRRLQLSVDPKELQFVNLVLARARQHAESQDASKPAQPATEMITQP